MAERIKAPFSRKVSVEEFFKRQSVVANDGKRGAYTSSDTPPLGSPIGKILEHSRIMGKGTPEFDVIWHDRDIRFDVHPDQLRLRAGEHQIEKIEHVEDVKGNNGDRGTMRVTNLRVIWHSATMARINLSIGLNAMNGVTTRTANSRLRGQTESLYVMARTAVTRFEFIFTCLNPTHTRLFTTVIHVHRAYETSKLYRELKMRGAIIDEEERVKLLPGEEQFNRIEGVWNLSSDQGNLGYFSLTNVRLVWHAAVTPHYNVSIPYLQLKSCKVRESKFGVALVVETSQQSGDYVLGFRIDPVEKLHAVAKELQSLRRAFQAKPIFGVRYTRERAESPDNSSTEPFVPVEDDVQIEEQYSRPDAFAAYFVGGDSTSTSGGGQDRGPVYSEELGLAVQRLSGPYTLKDLWEINVD